MATMTSTSSRMEWSVWRWKPLWSPLPQDSAMAGKRTRLIDPASSDAGVARVSAEASLPGVLRRARHCGRRPWTAAGSRYWPRSPRPPGARSGPAHGAVRPEGARARRGPPGRGVHAVADGERQEQRRPAGADDEGRQQPDKADRAAEHVPDRGALHLAGTELHATDEGVPRSSRGPGRPRTGRRSGHRGRPSPRRGHPAGRAGPSPPSCAGRGALRPQPPPPTARRRGRGPRTSTRRSPRRWATAGPGTSPWRSRC